MINDITAHFYKKLYIDNSVISGKGLFTSERIQKGERILSFGGILALQSDRGNPHFIPSTYAGLTENIIICESTESEKDYSDYINHSCEPNIGMEDCLTIIAINDIAIGEELLCDYSFWEADEKWVLKQPCNCGKNKCRKRITGMDWKRIPPNDPSFNYYSPFLQRKIVINSLLEVR